MGLTIIRNMEKASNEWEDGDILDPENGKVYRCKSGENGNLQVRGYPLSNPNLAACRLRQKKPHQLH